MIVMTTYNDEWLAHHGIKGQRWGVRRYQNADGSLTPKGKARMDAALKDSENLSYLHARLEDQTRRLTRNVPKGNKILTDSDTVKQYKETVKQFTKMHETFKKKYSSIESSPITRNGKDYIYTLLVDKKTGMGAEYLTELHEKRWDA